MTNPLPAEHATNASYAACSRKWVNEHNSPGYWTAEMATFHDLLPSGSILEIGAGGGRDAAELIALGYDYYGTDVSSEMIDVARDCQPETTFHQCSVYDLDSLGRTFDGFWASAVLLHIPRERIDLALGRIRAAVRPGGIGFISLKDGVGEQTEVEDVQGVELKRLFTYWSRDDFATALTRNGFETVWHSYHPRSPRTRWHCFIVRTRVVGAV